MIICERKQISINPFSARLQANREGMICSASHWYTFSKFNIKCPSDKRGFVIEY